MKNTALKKANILLPDASIPMEKWACIACDQFTAQRDYWDAAEEIVGDTPSTLRLMLPEIDLNRAEERTPKIHAAMKDYRAQGILSRTVEGFVLVERMTSQGLRCGLIGTLDLEQYDPSPRAVTPIRATEGTVPSRVPPRAAVRRGASLELPHVMMLIDDPEQTVIEPLVARRVALKKMYNCELMLGGGHVAGYAVEGEDAQAVLDAVQALGESTDAPTFCVGDGNHSLAAAKLCWEEIKAKLDDAQCETHPARYALVELVNVHCPALVFEPIHRLLTHANFDVLIREYQRVLNDKGIAFSKGDDVVIFTASKRLGFSFEEEPLKLLQEVIDAYVARTGAEVDYIHGDVALKKLVDADAGNVGILLKPMDKARLFATVEAQGALPRKAFSMGEATDKRYYIEARRIAE